MLRAPLSRSSPETDLFGPQGCGDLTPILAVLSGAVVGN
jgi:hypothetical protein